jgi:ubiquinone/menaquinone biosynthesis C-methylase UbiE
VSASDEPRQVIDTFRRRAARYDDESSWVRETSLIEPLFGGLLRDDVIVDVCSGTGAASSFAASLGLHPIAVDLSEDMLRLNPVSARLLAEGSRLPLITGAARRVVCRQGLHYLDVYQALAEFARVATHSIAIGSITMVSESDRPFWTEYFQIASPGRRHIFGPGQIARVMEEMGLDVTSALVVNDRGSLYGPIRHLSTRDRKRLAQMFTRPEFVARYDVDQTSGDATYSQRWEFIVASSQR